VTTIGIVFQISLGFKQLARGLHAELSGQGFACGNRHHRHKLGLEGSDWDWRGFRLRVSRGSGEKS
jgi:hypothetical protein